MKKFFAVMIVCLVALTCSICSAAGKTGILIIAPTEFKTQDFMKIANESFGKNYIVSQQTQDAWAAYCWEKGFVDSDPTISKDTLADFAATTYFDKIIFIMFKDAVKTFEDLGAVYNRFVYRRAFRFRTAIQARVVIMNQSGETLKVFEDSYTDASFASELRANRGAFDGLCKNIAVRLNPARLKR